MLEVVGVLLEPVLQFAADWLLPGRSARSNRRARRLARRGQVVARLRVAQGAAHALGSAWRPSTPQLGPGSVRYGPGFLDVTGAFVLPAGHPRRAGARGWEVVLVLYTPGAVVECAVHYLDTQWTLAQLAAPGGERLAPTAR